MSQNQNSFGKGREEDFAEASLVYVLRAFEEQVEEDASKVWAYLPGHTKAHLRRMMAKEQLLAGEPLC